MEMGLFYMQNHDWLKSLDRDELIEFCQQILDAKDKNDD